MFNSFSKLEIREYRSKVDSKECEYQYCRENSIKRKNRDKQNNKSESKPESILEIKKTENDSKQDRNEIVERMEAMELRRISEDLPENERDRIEEANDEILPNQQDSNMRNENPNIEIIQVEQDAPSSSMQLEDNKDSPHHEAESSRSSDNVQPTAVQPPE